MKKILGRVFLAMGCLLSFSAQLLSSEKNSSSSKSKFFFDPLSGITLSLPTEFNLIEEESDLNGGNEEGGRWMVFSDEKKSDIALIIYRLARPLSTEEFFFNHILKEFDELLPSHTRTFFGRPSMQRLTKNGLVCAKIQYPVLNHVFAAHSSEYLITEYFFTHDQYGFNIWISPEQNDLEELQKLEKQIEQMLDAVQFTSSVGYLPALNK